MQLVQVDDVHGRRAAVTTFASDASSLRFVLVPVCPVGEPAYYETVREMLRSCDLVVIVPPRARRGWVAGLLDLGWGSQWWRIARGRRIRLSTPPDAWDGVDRPFIKARAVQADTAPSEGGSRARKPCWSPP